MGYVLLPDAPCRICDLLAEDDHTQVIVDGRDIIAMASPWQRGPNSVLIATRRHAHHLAELSDHEAVELFQMCREVTALLREVLDPDGINSWLAAGVLAEQPVPHLVVEVVPRWFDFPYSWIPPGDLRTAPVGDRRAVARRLGR